MNAMWRCGRGPETARAIYRQVGDEPSAEDLFIGIVDKPRHARIIVAALERLFDDWHQPSIGEVWEPRGDGLILTVAEVRADGKLICSRDDGIFTVVSVEDLNIDYVLTGQRQL